jgi:hypothetical protein
MAPALIRGKYGIGKITDHSAAEVIADGAPRGWRWRSECSNSVLRSTAFGLAARASLSKESTSARRCR